MTLEFAKELLKLSRILDESRQVNFMNQQLWLVGYGAWTASKRAEGLVATLLDRGVTWLVDVRLNPAASDPQPGRTYGPKPWNLQAGREAGLAGLLKVAGINYEWLVELGNPQRRDPEMTILRSHLADLEAEWPVHRGLERLARLIRQPGEVVAILCACEDWRKCHRTVVARALSDRHFADKLTLLDARTGQAIPALPRMEG
jgi:hypothetical protein